MPTVAADRLVQLGSDIFSARGASPEESRIISNSLVESNLAGHDSHGVIRIPSYIEKLDSGGINPGAELTVVSDASNAVTLDGNWGFGQVMARRAMETAVERAADSAIFAATLRRVDHIGRLGEYSALAAEKGFVGIIMSNGHGAGQLIAPHGGKEARLATTPISICAPAGNEPPVLLDFATSVVAEGKVRVALNRGEQLKEGCILDADGNQSVDPRDLYGPPGGTLLPFGGIAAHKGYALGFMIELLAGILSGAGTSCRDPERFGNATFICVVRIEAFLPLAEFCKQVHDFAAYVRSCPKAPGSTEILIPGEIEARERRKRIEEGIYLSDETWDSIIATARSAGVMQA
jgi:LDH2 family malate/lactate/ureidoglycolate dehydrogenase